MTALCAVCFLAAGGSAPAQNYTQAPVTISAEKTRGQDGKIYYCHTVLERQTLFSVAKAYGVSTDDICKANPELDLKKDGLKKGSVILIPYNNEAGKNAAVEQSAEETESQEDVSAPEPEPVVEKAAPQAAKKQKKSEDYFIHVTRWYEDLEDISHKYSVPLSVLMEYNGLSGMKLKNRQKLRIPIEYKSGNPIDEDTAVKGKGMPGRDEGKTTGQPSEKPVDDTKKDDQYEIEYPAGNAKVNALLMLPFGASGKPSESNFDFYSGVLLAVNQLKEEGKDIDLSVYDVASGIPVTKERLAASDFAIGPLGKDQVTKVLSIAPENTAIISPLDPKTYELTGSYRNMIQAPSSLQEQYQDLLNWVRTDRRTGDKVIIINEKSAASTGNIALMASAIENSGITVERYAYNILEGRNAVNALEKMLTTSGTNRVIVNSEKEAFVNDAVRNLAMLVYRKFNMVLYSPSKIRSFETIDPENLHDLNAHVSASYFIDYDSHKVSDFLMEYRALFNMEPTRFAFQGYDLAYYFISMKARYGRRWMHELENSTTSMLQSDFRFTRRNDGGYVNEAVRRIVYGPDYSIKISR